MRKHDWSAMRGEVTSAFGCATEALVFISIDAGFVALIAWLIRTIVG